MVLNCKWPKPVYCSKVSRHQHIKILAHLHKKQAQERCLKSEKVAPTQARCGSSERLLIYILVIALKSRFSGNYDNATLTLLNSDTVNTS